MRHFNLSRLARKIGPVAYWTLMVLAAVLRVVSEASNYNARRLRVQV
jgi:hypothetical protein